MSFLQSPEMIYEQMQLGGKALKWSQEDWFTFFSKLVAQGFIWDAEDNRLRQKGFLGLMNNTPWCHAKSTATKHCSLDHNIIFVSSGKKDFMKNLPFKYFDDIRDAMGYADKALGKNSKIYVVPRTLSTIAKLK